MEEEENVYEVPPAPRTSHVNDFTRREPVNAPPPLMPKKGDSFRISSANLGRRVPPKIPKPAPRKLSFNRNSSLDSLPVENDQNSSNLTRNASVDLGDINNPESLDVVQSLPQVKSRASPNLSSSDGALTSSSESFRAGPSEVDKQAAVRPKPKPRSRPSKVLERPNPPLEKPNDEQPFAPISDSSSEDLAWKNAEQKNVDVENCSKAHNASDSNISFSIPPDADSLELQFDKEVNDKYSFNEPPKITDAASLAAKDNEVFPEQQDPFNAEAGEDDSYFNVQEFKKFLDKDIASKAKDESTSSRPSEAESSGIDLGTSLFSDSSSEKSPLPLLPGSSSAFPTDFDCAQSITAHPKGTFGVIDLSDLDPLWQFKCDRMEKSSQSTVPRIPQNDTHEVKHKKTNSVGAASSHSAVPGFSNARETYPSLPNQAPKPHFVAKPVETLATPGTSSWEEPLAPPPPLPNLVRSPRPPPVPPRPNNSSKLPTSRPENLETFSGGNKSQSIGVVSDPFKDLPTPLFSPIPDNGDPFEGSGFDEYCTHFNAKAVVSAIPSSSPSSNVVSQSVTAIPHPSNSPKPWVNSETSDDWAKWDEAASSSPPLPTPPSPSTKPKWPDVDSTSVTAGARGGGPSDDPDRISRFVPPPPGGFVPGAAGDGPGYVLARGRIFTLYW